MDEKERISFARAMLAIVDGVMSGEISNEHAANRLKSGARWLAETTKTEEAGIEPPKASERLMASMDEVRDIFEYWQTATGRPKAKLDNKRVGIIRSALARFSAAQLKHIVKWASEDDFYGGLNERGKRYDWIETLFRSVSRIEDLLERSAWSTSRGAVDEFREKRRLEEESARALREGRIEDYNQMQLDLEESEDDAID